MLIQIDDVAFELVVKDTMIIWFDVKQRSKDIQVESS